MLLRLVNREACPLCNAQAPRLLCDLAYDEAPLAPFLHEFYGGRLHTQALAGNRYRVLRCSRCGLIYQDPILDADGMRLLYQDWVDQAASLDKKRHMSAARKRQYAGQLRTLQRLSGKSPAHTRVLEYGMGWGYWCRMARDQGFDVSGFELSAMRRDHARKMGVAVVEKLAGEYDFIYANQVFEHLPDPLQTLLELCSHLHADGIVYLRVPDGREVARQLRNSGWSPLLDAIHPLEHINCFTRASLIRLAASAGLRQLQAPLRLERGRLLASLRREILDRWFTTHLMFRR